MAAGLPVVVTLNGGGSDDILDHGRNRAVLRRRSGIDRGWAPAADR
ncbi:MAG: hypothetical protein R3A46_18360 [Thermomicrobiales bacterium]